MEQGIPAGSRAKAAPEKWSPSCAEEASPWMFVRLLKHPPFINKSWRSFPHLPTLSFLSRFFVHNQALPPSGWLDCPPASVPGGEVPSWQHWWHAVAPWPYGEGQPPPPSLSRDVVLPGLQPQTVSLIFLPHCTVNTLNSELEPDLSFLLLFNPFWTVPPALAPSCTPPLSHDSGEFMAILQVTIKKWHNHTSGLLLQRNLCFLP